MNKEKSINRRIKRLRNVQNPSAVDLKRIRTRRDARTELWRFRKKTVSSTKSEAKPVKKTKKEEKPAKPKKEPELELIDKELEEIFDVDEDEETDADDTES